MSSSTTSVAERLRRPLGPYSVFQILQDRRSLSGRPLPLQSVQLTYRGQIIGFDMIDEPNRNKACIRFKGVLNIKQTRWLSEQGSTILQRDFRRRTGLKDLEYWIRNGKVDVLVKVSGDLYGYPVLDDNDIFHVLSFKGQRAGQHVLYDFSVMSMRAPCYTLSKCFISRYRTWRVIQTIVSRHKSITICRRTPKWLVRRYLEENYEWFKKTVLNRTHTARIVHRSQVYSLFGKHAGWLSQTIKKLGGLDPGSWDVFYREIERQKREGGVIDCDSLEKLWPDSDDAMETDLQPNTDTPVRQKSLSPTLDEQWVAPSFARVTNPDILREFRKDTFLHKPTLPQNYEWHCPDEMCHYIINFRDLSEENLGNVSSNDIAFLRSIRWNPSDSRVIEIFHDMVERHYFKHLTKVGVKLVASRQLGRTSLGEPIFKEIYIKEPGQLLEEDTDLGFEWIKPAHHSVTSH